MHDAARLVIILLSGVAIYLSARLAWVHFRCWRVRPGQRRGWMPVVLVTAGLTITSGAVLVALVVGAGGNNPLTWRESAHLAQTTLVVCGLRPLWRNYQKVHGMTRATRATRAS